MWRIIINILLAIAAGVIIFYLLPADVKERGLGLLESIVPDSIKEKIEPIIYTPVERRQKLLDKLESNVTRLKTILSDNKPAAADNETIASVFQETDNIISKIKEANAEQSPVNKITTALTDKATEIFLPQPTTEITAPANTNCK